MKLAIEVILMYALDVDSCIVAMWIYIIIIIMFHLFICLPVYSNETCSFIRTQQCEFLEFPGRR